MSKSPGRPASVGNTFVNMAGALSLVYAIFLCKQTDRHGVEATLVGLMTYSFIITMLEIVFLRTPAKPENGLDFRRFSPSLSRIFFKLVGIAACYGTVIYLYWLFPEYHGNMLFNPNFDGFYVPFGDAAQLMLPLIAVLAVPYVAVMDAVMLEPEDRFCQLGRLLLRQKHNMTRKALAQMFWSWVARGYFVALLFVYADRAFNAMIDFDFDAVQGTAQFYSLCYQMVVALGMMIAVSGNMVTLRLMGTHVRSVDPYLSGWLICLFCFQPFKSFVNDYVAPRGPEDSWIQALAQNPVMLNVWAGLLIVTLAGSLMADISLGARFSYLQHRGIVTRGMYRFSKHPSYVLTWVQFLLIYFPLFAFQETEDIYKAFIALAGLGLMYWLRAFTEERHLSRDPVYVQYALWMNEHGALRWVGNWLPALRYRPPAHVAPQDKPYEGIR
ncbi:MAG: hypothetical protein EBV03_03675 [Proteobacteria bacterium]|nr:hypothetical protein [Pseudomonadota bacterium]